MVPWQNDTSLEHQLGKVNLGVTLSDKISDASTEEADLVFSAEQKGVEYLGIYEKATTLGKLPEAAHSPF